MAHRQTSRSPDIVTNLQEASPSENIPAPKSRARAAPIKSSGVPSSNDTTVTGLINASTPTRTSSPPEIVSKSLSDTASSRFMKRTRTSNSASCHDHPPLRPHCTKPVIKSRTET